jgi:hypothetical protein
MAKTRLPLPAAYRAVIKAERKREIQRRFRVSTTTSKMIVDTGLISNEVVERLNPLFEEWDLDPLRWERLALEPIHAMHALPERPEPDQLLSMAAKHSHGETCALAPTFAGLAFRSAFVAHRRLSDALRYLPDALYYAYRYGSQADSVRMLNHLVMPTLNAVRKSEPMDELAVHTIFVRAACAFNEGGLYTEARELFEGEHGRALRHRDDVPPPLKAQIARNHAHSLFLQQELGRATDRLEEAAAYDDSIHNRLSVSHTKCEMYLANQIYGNAWESIEEIYRRSKSYLTSDQTDCRPGGYDVLHAFGTVLYGAVSRISAKASYTADERDEDILLLENCLSRSDHSIKIAHRSEYEPRTPSESFKRLRPIIDSSSRGNMARSDALESR